jgi:hypothetical protein
VASHTNFMTKICFPDKESDGTFKFKRDTGHSRRVGAIRMFCACPLRKETCGGQQTAQDRRGEAEPGAEEAVERRQSHEVNSQSAGALALSEDSNFGRDFLSNWELMYATSSACFAREAAAGSSLARAKAAATQGNR